MVCEDDFDEEACEEAADELVLDVTRKSKSSKRTKVSLTSARKIRSTLVTRVWLTSARTRSSLKRAKAQLTLVRKTPLSTNRTF